MIIAEPLIKLLIKKYIMDNRYVNYLPMNVAEDLMPAPLTKISAGMANSDNYEFFLPFGEASVLTVIYAALFLSLIHI